MSEVVARPKRKYGEGGTGTLSSAMFAETIQAVFQTKKAFAEYAGLSIAQVQRYTAGISPVPRPIALLLVALSELKRRGEPAPDLSEFVDLRDLAEAAEQEHLASMSPRELAIQDAYEAQLAAPKRKRKPRRAGAAEA